MVFVHTSTKIGLVIQNLQKAKVEMAIVVDSYGTIDGLVTTEDIVEELVGEIWDEHDRMTSSFARLPNIRILLTAIPMDKTRTSLIFSATWTLIMLSMAWKIIPSADGSLSVWAKFPKKGLPLTKRISM